MFQPNKAHHDYWREEQLEKALRAAEGYLLNAKIDLETGAPKRTAIATIEGGLKMVRTALSTLPTSDTEKVE